MQYIANANQNLPLSTPPYTDAFYWVKILYSAKSLKVIEKVGSYFILIQTVETLFESIVLGE